jgi:hypothetical protein
VNLADKRGILDAAWRQLFTFESGGAHMHSCEVMLDVSKAYERMLHQELADFCDRLRRPVAIARCSILSYRWARRLQLDASLTSSQLWPSRGIGAGFFWATFEVSAYLVSTLEYLNSLRATGTITIHVDDVDIFVCCQNKC